MNSVGKGESRGLDWYPTLCVAHKELHQQSHCVATVRRNYEEKMVLNLEVEVSTEPGIEGKPVDTACCQELGGDPVQCAWGYGSSVSFPQTIDFPGT